MDDQFEDVFEERDRHRISFHLAWTEAVRIAIALPLLFVALFSASGQSLQPGHLPSTKQVAPMTPAEEKNLAFVLDWWREVIEARHTELGANYAAEDFIQHNPNIPTGRAALMTFFKSLGPAIEPIPERVQNPPVVAGAKANFVWLVFEHKFKNPKDSSQWVYEYSFDLFRLQNGKIQEHWDAARKDPGSPAFIPSTAPPPSTWNTAKPSTAEQQNLAIATRFEKNVVEYGHIEDIEKLLSSSFIEHNPVEPVDREGLKQFIHSLPDHQPQDIKPEWKNAPVLEFADGPFVVMMWDKRYKDPSDPTREYTRNHFAILRIEDGRIQEIWD
ncbi:MAG TPA: nuclear transport factor 2 family protein [Bryobacteraceae bacterium]|nr:nuclear transport factor 2 family protein [Bryobacteraceae bacterium]